MFNRQYYTEPVKVTPEEAKQLIDKYNTSIAGKYKGKEWIDKYSDCTYYQATKNGNCGIWDQYGKLICYLINNELR